MTNGVLDRIDDLERRLQGLDRELRELRAEVAGAPEPAPTPTPPPRPAPRAAYQRAAGPRPRPPRREEPSVWQRELTLPKVDLADLLGARALAWAGGVVTLLGVVFFFVLAVNRGWIGPVERVGLGALASLLLLVGGLLMKHRYGHLYSALSAVGAGIAGAYATLLAAAALYDLVPDLVALTVAAGIAAVGTAVALAWKSETVASLGLVGASLVPAAALFDGGITALGTTFAGLMFAATAVVAIRRRWDVLLAAGGLALVPQAAWLVLDTGEGAPWTVVATTAFVWLLLLGAGLARYEARDGETESLSIGFVLASVLISGISARVLLEGEIFGLDKDGVALAAVATTYLALAAAWFRRERDLSALLGAVGLTVGAVATASLLGGGTLAVAMGAEAALLAWLSYRIAEPRYGLASLGYLVLAVTHTVVIDAPPHDLFVASAYPAENAFPVALVGVAALGVAYFARRWHLPRPAKSDWHELLVEVLTPAPPIAFVAGTTLLVEAASLGLLEAGVAWASFDWGEVAVTALWGLVAAAGLVAVRRWQPAELYGLAWLAAALVKVGIYDASRLDADQAGIAALALGGAVLAAGILGRAPVAVGLVPLAAVVAGAGAVGIGSTSMEEGLGLLAVAAPFAGLAALRFRDRARSTSLWASALGLAIVASPLLVRHTELVAAWAVGAVVLAALAELTRERRLNLGAYTLAGLALGYTLTELAPPADLLVKSATPADGVPALLLALGALVAVTWRVWDAPERDKLDRSLAEAQRVFRSYAAGAAAVLAVYAGSLILLGFSQELGGTVTTAFQRGHSAVSAFWGTIGLVALYLGLTRSSSTLRLAGFALFGVSLAKIFLYDLRTLSSVTRALSFLAVGAVLLLAGFFYQRLAGVAPKANNAT
jgi:uncharacterized membrane protein